MMMNMEKVSMEREMEMEKVAAHHLLSRDERDDAQWTLKEGLKSKLDVCHMLPLHSPRVRKPMIAWWHCYPNFFCKIPNPDNPETVRTIHEFDHFFVLLSTFTKIS